MDLQTGILAAVPPILAAFAERWNPVRDEFIRWQAQHTINELGLVALAGQATAVENATFGIARGAVSVASLIPALIAFLSTAIAIVNDLPNRFWWANGVLIFGSLATVLAIRAVWATTLFGLATDPATPVPATGIPVRRWRRVWDWLVGNTGTGAERFSRWICLFNVGLLVLIILNVAITNSKAARSQPPEKDPIAALLAPGGQIETLKARAEAETAKMDAEAAQIADLARRVSEIERIMGHMKTVPSTPPPAHTVKPHTSR
jgi:hypothetical protein